MAAAASMFFALFGSIVLLPLFMQELLDFPAITAGIWNSPRGIATMVMMPIAGYLISKRCDMRALLSGGLVISGIGAYMFSYLNLSAGPWDFFWPQIVMGAGLSFYVRSLGADYRRSYTARGNGIGDEADWAGQKPGRRDRQLLKSARP
jgi:hypothetical protein